MSCLGHLTKKWLEFCHAAWRCIFQHQRNIQFYHMLRKRPKISKPGGVYFLLHLFATLAKLFVDLENFENSPLSAVKKQAAVRARFQRFILISLVKSKYEQGGAGGVQYPTPNPLNVSCQLFSGLGYRVGQRSRRATVMFLSVQWRTTKIDRCSVDYA